MSGCSLLCGSHIADNTSCQPAKCGGCKLHNCYTTFTCTCLEVNWSSVGLQSAS